MSHACFWHAAAAFIVCGGECRVYRTLGLGILYYVLHVRQYSNGKSYMLIVVYFRFRVWPCSDFGFFPIIRLFD